jgi:hypothetical protein
MKEDALAVTQENLRTSHSSGQATTNPLLCHPILLACHSRAALYAHEDGFCWLVILMT